ncbi:response regulator [Allgaiera indica]|nr:response regulator [Allgaiera indica]
MTVGESLNVLLVEDDLGDAKALIRAMRRAQIAERTVHAKDGLEALSLMRDASALCLERYVILLDLNMPRMNGIEFLRALRQDAALRRAVVFVLTTSDDAGDVSAAHDMNVAGYFLKGRVGRNFEALVDTLSRYWELTELPNMHAGDRSRLQ